MSDRLEKENDMTDEKTWDELSDYYAGHTPEIIREIQVPDRALTADDLDDIFAGTDSSRPQKRAASTTRWATSSSGRPMLRGPKPISLRRPI